MTMMEMEFPSITITLDALPKCPKCDKGLLFPFPDESQKGSVFVKCWVCSNCLHNFGLRMGELFCLPVPKER